MEKGEKEIVYYRIRDVKKRGKEDGSEWRWSLLPLKWPLWEQKQQDPPLDQIEPAAYEEELKDCLKQNLSRIAQARADSEKVLQKTCTNAEDDYKRTADNLSEASVEHQEAIDEYETAKDHYFKQPRPVFSGIYFILLFAAISVAELYFNVLVFSIFGQRQMETYLMAFGLVASIPVAAHFIGKRLRMDKRSSMEIMIMIVSTIIVFGVLIAIALLREKFFEAEKTAEILGIDMGTGSIVFTFLIINIVLFLAMVLLSYESGYRDHETFKEAKRRFIDAEKEFNEETGDERKAAEDYTNAIINFNNAHANRKNELERVKHKAAQERDIWATFIKTYRSYNMAARKNKTIPASFKEDPTKDIKIPEMDIDCSKCIYDSIKK